MTWKTSLYLALIPYIYGIFSGYYTDHPVPPGSPDNYIHGYLAVCCGFAWWEDLNRFRLYLWKKRRKEQNG